MKPHGVAAWGKHWPREEKTLLRRDVLSVTSATPTASDINMDPDPLPEIISVDRAGPTTAASGMVADPPPDLNPTASDKGVDPLCDVHDFTYVCLKDIKILEDALVPTILFPRVLVCLAEYEPLIKCLNETANTTPNGLGTVVLGHPGIGS